MMRALVAGIAGAGALAGLIGAQAVGRTEAARVLRASKATMSAVAISPDGKLIAGASHDHTVRVWDAQSFRPVVTLTGHRGEVYDVAFSPDGKLAASVGYDGQLIFWSVPSGRLVRTIALGSWATSVAFSPDGKRLAVPLQSRQLRLFNVGTGKVDTSFTANTNSIAFSPSGQQIVWGGYNFAVRSAVTGDTMRVFRGHRGTVQSIEFSNDGQNVISASRDNSARIWNVVTGVQERMLEPEMPVRFRIPGRPVIREKLPLSHASFSPDGRFVATVGAGQNVQLWDASSGRLVTELDGESPAFTDVAFFPSGRQLAASGIDGTIRIFNVP